MAVLILRWETCLNTTDWACPQAVVLILDKDLVRWYLCDYNTSSGSMLLTAACSSGIVDTLLDWISPELLAKQVGWNVMNVVIIVNKSKRDMLVIPSCSFLAQVHSVFLSLFLALIPSWVSPSWPITFKVISLGRTKATGHGNRSHLGSTWGGDRWKKSN